jgi:hypothetical protein
MSAKYNLVCEQGTTFNFQFVIKNDDTPWNLTGYTATMTIRPFVGASTTTAVASTTNGMIVLNASVGRITVTIPSSQTAGFSASRHAYDLVLDSGSTITRALEGKFVVTPGVSV